MSPHPLRPLSALNNWLSLQARNARSEVRSSENLEPRTSNLRPSRQSRAASLLASEVGRISRVLKKSASGVGRLRLRLRLRCKGVEVGVGGKTWRGEAWSSELGVLGSEISSLNLSRSSGPQSHASNTELLTRTLNPALRTQHYRGLHDLVREIW